MLPQGTIPCLDVYSTDGTIHFAWEEGHVSFHGAHENEHLVLAPDQEHSPLCLETLHSKTM